MGGQQLLKRVGTLDHIKQRSDVILGDFYTHFNKELTSIDEVIMGLETIHAIVRALGPKGSTLYDSLTVIPIKTVEEMATRVKLYINLEIAKEGRKPIRCQQNRFIK